MRREDCIDLFNKIPESSHSYVNLILHNHAVLSVDVVARFESILLVFRGREAGTTDEGRGFFVPYEEIAYIRLDKVVRVGDLKLMFGETGYVDSEDRLAGVEQKTAANADAKPDLDVTTPQPTATPIIPMDPAAIAKQNLLDRIRAARANVAGTTGKFDKK